MKAKVKKNKGLIKERAAMFIIKAGLPYLLDTWKRDFPHITFDEFCENLMKEVNEK